MPSLVRFNLRAYGILLNEHNQVLVSDEIIQGKKYTKFPGGGLQFGEGLIDCLKREFMEETEIQVEVKEHIYTTDYFQPSAFDDESQVISVYYLVKSEDVGKIKVSDEPFDTSKSYNINQNFRWVKLDQLQFEQHLKLPIDKKVVGILSMLRLLLTNMM